VLEVGTAAATVALALSTAGTVSVAAGLDSVADSAAVAGWMVVWVKRLRRLVLAVPPTPTAGTAPSSEPGLAPGSVAKGLGIGVAADADVATVAGGADSTAMVSDGAFEAAGSVGDCRFQGDLGPAESPLTTYRLSGWFW
jgi:hypothetical protein